VIRKLDSKYDEVIIRTEDGGFVWKQYLHGELKQKQKYLLYRLYEVRREHPCAMVITGLPVIGR
jgi:hypothetical protein